MSAAAAAAASVGQKVLTMTNAFNQAKKITSMLLNERYYLLSHVQLNTDWYFRERWGIREKKKENVLKHPIFFSLIIHLIFLTSFGISKTF